KHMKLPMQLVRNLGGYFDRIKWDLNLVIGIFFTNMTLPCEPSWAFQQDDCSRNSLRLPLPSALTHRFHYHQSELFDLWMKAYRFSILSIVVYALAFLLIHLVYANGQVVHFEMNLSKIMQFTAIEIMAQKKLRNFGPNLSKLATVFKSHLFVP